MCSLPFPGNLSRYPAAVTGASIGMVALQHQSLRPQRPGQQYRKTSDRILQVDSQVNRTNCP